MAKAQSVDTPSTWGGDLASRPRLTGAWGGVRDELGKKGIVFDVDLLLTPQSVVSGGRSTGTDLWGNVDYTLNLDTQKAGLWSGGFFELQADTGFGSNVFHDSGALVPVNEAATLPGIDDRTTALTNASLTQFLNSKFGLMLGKFNTLQSGATEFYGDYRFQFMNEAFVSPMTLEQVPASAWGAGIVANPNADTSLSLQVLNPSGTATTNQVFGQGVEVTGSGQLTFRPFGLVGHQGVGFSWNDKERYSLEQDPSNIARLLLFSRFPRLVNPGPELTQILQHYFPGLLVPTAPPNTKSSSWAFSYTFDQYFWQPENKPEQGVGVFFAFGSSDGNPNPIKDSFLVGLGGKGVVPRRAEDSFGIGFASTEISKAFVPFLRQRLDLGLTHENAVEAYYSAAITAWLQVSADLQIVDPGLTKMLSGTGISTRLTNVNTAVIAGLRIRARF
jgi:porin